MSRWFVEKDGTGIEKSGTGIEKSGTGIEKSGTGVEKSGTGLRNLLFTSLIVAVVFCSSANANQIRPEGALQVVVDKQTIALSWIIDGSVFSGVASIQGSLVSLELTEVALTNTLDIAVDTTGGGTGSKIDTTGGGTGNSVDTTGGGTGASVETTGGGTGFSIETTGGGTGDRIETTGGGTGASAETTGGGTGSSMDTTGGGTGSSMDTTGGGTGADFANHSGNQIVLTTGGGTGSDSISITLPAGTGLQMEVSLRCDTASVSVLDAGFAEVVTFENVPVIGATGLCANDSHGKFDANRLQGAAKDGLD